MKRPDHCAVFLSGVAIIVFLAIFTPVSWLMGLTAGAFLLVGLVNAEESVSMSEVSEKNGTCFSSALIMLLIISGAVANWWLLLEYGLPMLFGLVYPMLWYEAAQDEQLL